MQVVNDPQVVEGADHYENGFDIGVEAIPVQNFTLRAARSEKLGMKTQNSIHSMLRRRKSRRIAAVATALLQNVDAPKYYIEGKARNVKRNRSYVVDKIKVLADTNPKYFQRMYRLHVKDFFALVELLRPIIGQKANRPEAIDPIIKLAITLRFLAGAISHDLSFGYELAHSCIHKYVNETLYAIDRVVDNIHFPFENYEELEKLEREFSRISGGRFTGTVAAGDGIVFKMEKPRSNEVEGNVLPFFTRKGYYAFGIQAMASANCKFLSISSRLCSSSHDSMAFSSSNVFHAINNGFLHESFHVVLDEAYICRGQFLTPYKGKNLPVDKDTFNYYLSMNRQVIERAFGILVRRWGIFWRPLRCSMDLIPLIIRVCCKLHNICVDRFTANQQLATYHRNIPSFPDSDFQADSMPTTLFTDGVEVGQGYRADLEVCQKREDLREHLMLIGARRPAGRLSQPTQRI